MRAAAHIGTDPLGLLQTGKMLQCTFRISLMFASYRYVTRKTFA